MAKTLLILSIIFLSISCRKDTSLDVGGNGNDPIYCIGDTIGNFDIDTLAFGYFTQINQIQYEMPCFNPDNSAEIVFIEHDYDGAVYSLTKLNLSSGLESILLDSLAIISPPKWSNGWIFFGTDDFNIWKLRDDGDSLVQLTFDGDNKFPEPSPDGTQLCYLVSGSGPYGEVFISTSGTLIDTVHAYGPGTGGWYESNWSVTDKICTSTGSIPDYGVGYFDLTTGVLETVAQWGYESGQDEIVAIKWHPNSEDIYLSKWSNDLLKINIHSGEQTIVKLGCFHHYYPDFSISADGQSIIACKLEVDSIISNQVLHIKQSIVLMNINGCEEVVVKSN